MEKDVPYIAHENDMARLERTNKRIWIVILILVVSLLVTNFGWIYYECHSIHSQITQDIDINGNSNTAGVGQ